MSSFKLRKEKDCLNCGHVVEENFCPHCGQENIVLKEDALHMVTHAVADYFHFEHKFFGTIKPLLLKPGKLTESYVAGKRVSFIHPIRLYIFVSIVFFLVILSGNKKNEKEPKEKKAHTTVDNSRLSLKQKDSLVDVKMKAVSLGMQYIPFSQKKKDSILRKAKEEIQNDVGISPVVHASSEKLTATEIKEIEESLKYVSNEKGLRDSLIKEAKRGAAKDDDSGANIKFGSGKKRTFLRGWRIQDTTVAAYNKKQLTLPKEKRDGFFKQYFMKRTIALNNYENPEEKFLEDLLHNIPKMMFLLLPLFALILKLVYINKNKFYYEHLIYSFHLHSALFLSVLITILFRWFFNLFFDIGDWLTLLCTFYIIWYIYRSLRTFYASTRWVTVLKMLFLFFAYNIVLTICFLLIIALSFVMI